MPLEERRAYLEMGFTAMNSDTGSTALEELFHEYAQLQPLLQRRRQTDPLAVAHLPTLVDEAYQQGLSILEDALELGRAVSLGDKEKLETDVLRLQEEVEALSRDGKPDTAIRMREEPAGFPPGAPGLDQTAAGEGGRAPPPVR